MEKQYNKIIPIWTITVSRPSMRPHAFPSTFRVWLSNIQPRFSSVLLPTNSWGKQLPAAGNVADHSVESEPKQKSCGL